jgi:hypothetical protein
MRDSLVDPGLVLTADTVSVLQSDPDFLWLGH